MGGRSLVRTGLVICAAWAMLAAACSGDDSAPSTTTGGAATTTPAVAKPYGGVARVRNFGFPFDSLNPFVEANYVQDAYLVGISRTRYAPCAAGEGARWCTEEVPDVLTKLPSFDNGGLVENPDGTVRVHLEIRPEAVWEDGVPISGDDLAFTYRLHSPEVAAIPLYELVDPESLVVGPKSLEFTLTTPDARWVYLFQPVVPKHDVEGSDFLADWNDRMWVSGGPFRFESWEDDYLVFSRNPNYWRVDPETGQQLPYLDRLEVGSFDAEFKEPVLEATPPEIHDLVECWFELDCRFALGAEEFSMVQDPFGRAVVDGLPSGVFDCTYFELDRALPAVEWVAPLADAEGIGGGVLDSMSWEFLAFNMGPGRLSINEDSWNEHLAFRRAVAYALDRDRIAEAAWGFPWRRLDSYMEIYSPALSNIPWDRYDYDPDRARELLAGLCDDLGRDCDTDPPRLVLTRTWWRTNRVNAAEEIAAQLGEVGIVVEIDAGAPGLDAGPIEAGCGDYDTSLLAEIGVGFGLAGLAGIISGFDPATPAGAGSAGVGGNFFRWGTPAVEGIEDDPATGWIDESCFNSGPSAVIDEHTDRMTDVIAEMRTTMDVDRLRPLVAEAEDILADQVVFIPLYAFPALLYWNTDLAGIGMNVFSGEGLLWNCEEWYRTDL